MGKKRHDSPSHQPGNQPVINPVLGLSGCTTSTKINFPLLMNVGSIISYWSLNEVHQEQGEKTYGFNKDRTFCKVSFNDLVTWSTYIIESANLRGMTYSLNDLHLQR